jgi:hypothetical protein
MQGLPMNGGLGSWHAALKSSAPTDFVSIFEQVA